MPTPSLLSPATHWAFRLADEAATEALGQSLGRALGPGDHLALLGQLGAGKTTLCRHIAAGFGVADLNQVASPTYAYAHTYQGPRGSLHHLDFYRLEDAESAYALGLDDILADAHSPCLIEWADRVPELVAPQALWLRLTRQPGREGRDGLISMASDRATQLRTFWPADIPIAPGEALRP